MSPAELLNLLSRHVGQAHGVHVEHLAQRTGVTPRELRKLITQLRADGVAVCGKPETGYFIAETPAELDDFCIRFLEARAMHSLKLSSRLRKIPLPVLAGQLFLNQA